jgi:hypothetical protein
MGKPINASNIEGFTKIYIGHTPTTVNEYTKPQMMGNVINVDQGCKKKGILTAWIDETDEYFQNV